MVVSVRRMYLWRAVDSEGEILDLLVQPTRDKTAALRLMRKLLRKQGHSPRVLVTDRLPSYGAARRQLGLAAAMSRACARTIGPRIPTRSCDDGSGRCSASSQRPRPSASFRSTLCASSSISRGIHLGST